MKKHNVECIAEYRSVKPSKRSKMGREMHNEIGSDTLLLVSINYCQNKDGAYPIYSLICCKKDGSNKFLLNIDSSDEDETTLFVFFECYELV